MKLELDRLLWYDLAIGFFLTWIIRLNLNSEVHFGAMAKVYPLTKPLRANFEKL